MSEVVHAAEVTALIRGAGDADIRRRLLEIVYGDLRRLAAHMMGDARNSCTLQPTALVNEFVVKVLAPGGDLGAENRQHLISIAAQAMRRLLVDHARAKRAGKRGGGAAIVVLEEGHDGVAATNEKLLLINDALDHLAELNQRQAKVAELRIFGGLSVAEIAQHLNVTTRTVDRDWVLARGFLQLQLK